jgi:hypothetical protein
VGVFLYVQLARTPFAMVPSNSPIITVYYKTSKIRLATRHLTQTIISPSSRPTGSNIAFHSIRSASSGLVSATVEVCVSSNRSTKYLDIVVEGCFVIEIDISEEGSHMNLGDISTGTKLGPLSFRPTSNEIGFCS